MRILYKIFQFINDNKLTKILWYVSFLPFLCTIPILSENTLTVYINSIICLSFIYLGEWEMIGNNICYGARRGMYGVIKLRREGFITALKLDHVSGFLTCDRGRGTSYSSNWGCYSDGDRNGITNKHVSTFVTDDNDYVIFPQTGISDNMVAEWQRKPYYQMAGYKGNCKELVFSSNCTPMYARYNQMLRIWYGEALFRNSYYPERDNGGKHCVNIYAKFD